MPVVDVAVEVAYIDFGLLGLFGKLGYVSWDADLDVTGFSSSEDSTDPGDGVEARLTFASLKLRAEYGIFEFDDADVDLATIGFVCRF